MTKNGEGWIGRALCRVGLHDLCVVSHQPPTKSGAVRKPPRLSLVCRRCAQHFWLAGVNS